MLAANNIDRYLLVLKYDSLTYYILCICGIWFAFDISSLNFTIINGKICEQNSIFLFRNIIFSLFFFDYFGNHSTIDKFFHDGGEITLKFSAKLLLTVRIN